MRLLMVMMFALGLVAGCGDAETNASPYPQSANDYPESCLEWKEIELASHEHFIRHSRSIDVETTTPCADAPDGCSAHSRMFAERFEGVRVTFAEPIRDRPIVDAEFRLHRITDSNDSRVVASNSLEQPTRDEPSVATGDELWFRPASDELWSAGLYNLEIDGNVEFYMDVAAIGMRGLIAQDCLEDQ